MFGIVKTSIGLMVIGIVLIVFSRQDAASPAPVLTYRTLTGHVLQLPERADIQVLSGGDIVIFSVMYPSMHPIDKFGRGEGGKPMRLTLNRLPQIRSLADDIVDGKYPSYKFEGQSGSRRIYFDKDPQTGNVSRYAIFMGFGGALVIFEDPGTWSVNYHLMSNDRIYGYGLEAIVSKKIKDDPTQIDAALTRYLRGLATASPSPNREKADL